MRVCTFGLLPTLLVSVLWASAVVAGEASRDAVEREEGVAALPGGDGEEPVELGELAVVARRPEPYRFQDVLEADEVECQRVSGTVEGLFEGMAGVDLHRRTFAGNENSRLSIRGFDESRCRVLLNGRPLHGAGVYGGYYIDWNSLTLEDVERIEIIRGMAPAKYGNTLGGVVNIVPRKGSEVPRTTVRLGGGAIRHVDGVGMWNTQVSHAWGCGPLLWNLSAGHYETDGVLRNAFVDRDTFGGSLTLKLPADLELTLAGRYTKSKSGMIVYNMPDSPYHDSRYPDALGGELGGPMLPFRNHGEGLWGPLDWGDGSYWRDERLNLDVTLSRHTDTFSFDLGAYYIDQDRSEHFLAVTDDHDLVLRRESEPEKNNWGWRADFQNDFEWLGTHTLEYGAAGHYLGYGDIDVRSYNAAYFPPNHPNVQDSAGKERISDHNSGYVQDRWAVTEWMEVLPGIRFDDFRAHGPAGTQELREKRWSPRLAATVRPWQGGHVTARGGLAYRFPTLPEYYWFYNGFQPAGRSPLTAERAEQWELEVGHEVAERFAVLLRAYHYDVDDYIRTIFGYRPSRVVYNIDSVTFTGVELEARYSLPHGFFVWGNATWQRTEKTGDALDGSSQLSDELVELPRRKFLVGLGYRKEGGLEARLSLRFVDDRHAIVGDFATPGATRLVRMESYFDLDFYASYPLWQGESGRETRVELAVNNILNDHYEEEHGYPMPGITVLSGLRMRF